MLQCPSSLKQINFKMECFSSLSDKPSIYYKYRGDLLQHSVVNQNNKTQSRNSRAVALSTHTRLRFNSSSLSSLLGAFDLVSLCFLIFLVFYYFFLASGPAVIGHSCRGVPANVLSVCLFVCLFVCFGEANYKIK